MEPLWLPPGFRFHPLDDELVEAYLIPKVKDSNFTVRHIGEVDLNRCEPWDLPGMAKIGEKEWYFYAVRDRKYPTGMRTNRATYAGYWKATGKDKEVMTSCSSRLLGMKKTLVFYKGRAPRGEKTNWIMHEYRLESDCHISKLPKDSEWVVCRIFKKTPGGKRAHIKDIQSSTFYNEPLEVLNGLPPLESPHPTASKDPGFDSDVSGQNDHLTEFRSQDYQNTFYNGFRSDQSDVWDPAIHGVHSINGPIARSTSISDIVSMFNFNSSYQDMHNNDQQFSEASTSVNAAGKLRQGALPLPPVFRSNLFAPSSSKGSDQLSKAFVDYYVYTDSRSPLRQCKVEPDVGVSENALESSQRTADHSLLSDNACYEASKDLSVAESFPHGLFRSSTPSIVEYIDGFSWTY